MNFSKNKCISGALLITLHVVAGILMALFFGLIFGLFVMLLWNFLMPDIFGLSEISYIQGAGLVMLFRLLFGSHGYKGHKHPDTGCHEKNTEGSCI